MNLDDFFNKHKAVRRVVLLWCLVLATWISWRVFGDNPPAVAEWTGKTFNFLLVAVLAPVILYFFHRKKDDSN